MTDAHLAHLAHLAASEHDLLIASRHAAQRTLRRPYLSPVTGIILSELRRFHACLLRQLESLASLPAIAVLLEDHRFLELRLAGLAVRYERGEELAVDIDEAIGDWYRLHAIRHAWVQGEMAPT